MSLMFTRLAQNFVKRGYFPTDEDTLSRVLQALDIDGTELRILDPCCGEGIALAEVKCHLTACGARISAYGVEVDRERAWHAKDLLDMVAHNDLADVFVSARSVGLLWLNPPYGDVVADKASTGGQGSDRLEKVFYRRSVGWLQFGGILVLIVPSYVMDAPFAHLIARHFDDVKVFLAPQQRFRQIVLLGRKRRADSADTALASRLAAIGQGELPALLPAQWCEAPYCVPALVQGPFAFTAVRLDAIQLERELARLNKATLWPQFATTFAHGAQTQRRPLADLTDWHLALALAAGQISGVVSSAGGRRLLIRGDTFKDKELTVTTDAETGATTRTFTDRFVPAITGIDFTPGEHYGELVSIR